MGTECFGDSFCRDGWVGNHFHEFRKALRYYQEVLFSTGSFYEFTEDIYGNELYRNFCGKNCIQFLCLHNITRMRAQDKQFRTTA